MTVCFLIKNTQQREVLLGYKKIGFGAGKYAGIGEKSNPARELNGQPSER